MATTDQHHSQSCTIATTVKEAFLGYVSYVSMRGYIDNVVNVLNVKYTSHLRRRKRDIAEKSIHAPLPHRQSQWANHLSQWANHLSQEQAGQ